MIQGRTKKKQGMGVSNIFHKLQHDTPRHKEGEQGWILPLSLKAVPIIRNNNLILISKSIFFLVISYINLIVVSTNKIRNIIVFTFNLL